MTSSYAAYAVSYHLMIYDITYSQSYYILQPAIVIVIVQVQINYAQPIMTARSTKIIG